MARHLTLTPFDLERFIKAQKPVYEAARSELLTGKKLSHWMWFVFPQFSGLGHSSMATLYGITSLAEARAYLAHPLLGSRLTELTDIVVRHADSTARQIFGSPDDLKFRSSMTLFCLAAPDHWSFRGAIETFFGSLDQKTIALLTERGEV